MEILFWVVIGGFYIWQLLIIIGQMLVNRKRFAAALYVYKILIVLFPVNWRVFRFNQVIFNNRGYAYQGIRQYDKSLDNLDKVLAFNPKYRMAYLNRGTTHALMNKLELALADFEQILALDPEDERGLYSVGAVQFSMKNYTDAVENFTDVIDSNIDIPVAASSVSTEQEKSKRWRQWYYRNAIPFEILLCYTYSLRSRCYTRLEDYQLAIQDANKAIEILPNSSFGYTSIAYMHYHQQSFSKALEYYLQGLKYDPTNHNLLERVGVCYYALQNYSEALQYFDNSIKSNSDYLAAKAGKAITVFTLGDTQTAIQQWKLLLEQDPTFTDIDHVIEEFGWSRVDQLKDKTQELLEHIS